MDMYSLHRFATVSIILAIISSFIAVHPVEAKKIESRSESLSLNEFYIDWIFGWKDGDLKIDFDSNIPLDIYILTEDDYEETQKTFPLSMDIPTYGRKIENHTEGRITYECDFEGNHALIILNSGNHGDNKKLRIPGVFNITAETSKPDSFIPDFDLILVILIVVPVSLLIVGYIIRKRIW
jgi:hypothetical protein